MKQADAATDHYLSEFARFEKEISRKEPAWLKELRRKALERFADRKFPTARDEEWKYTSVAPIAGTPFRVASSRRRNGISRRDLEHALFGGLECTILVFVNGHHAPELSRGRPLPDGVKAGSLAEFLEREPGLVEPHLARYARFEDQAFTALNTAFLKDGAFVHVPKMKVLSEPIHLLFVTTGPGAPPVSHPRNLIVVEEGSQVAVVENYVTLLGGAYFTNAVTEVVAGASSVVDHCKLQREGEEACHISTLQSHLGRNSRFTSHAIALGGALVRNDVNSVLDAEGAECVLNGLYLAVGCQHMDNHTFIMENSTIRGRSLINLRSDYGSTWQGEFIIRNCVFVPAGGRPTSASLIGGSYSGQHDFGYTCYMPERITIENLKIDDSNHPEDYQGPAIFANFNPKMTDNSYVEKFPYIKTREVILKNVTTASGTTLRLSDNPVMFKNVKVITE